MPPQRHTGPAPESEHPDYAGRYLLEAALGSGGMGVVHLATSASGLRLAVKVIHGHHASDPEFRARFRQEVAAARRVSGAFTAPVVDADPEAVRPWMATLFIDGPTLSERVKRNGPLDYEELVRFGAGLAEGLRDIHRAGVVHRDLKPSNVLLAADGPKVIDFGISRPVDSDLRTETGKLIGTPPFMAPEQFQRPREVGPAADVFALGAVLVHAATGRGPFDSDSPYIVAYQVVHDEPDLTGVPDGLIPLVTRCLAKEPADRPTPDELMTALRLNGPGGTGGPGGSGVTDGTDGTHGGRGPAHGTGTDTASTHGSGARPAHGVSPLVPARRAADTAESARPSLATTHSPAAPPPQTVQSTPTRARRRVRRAVATGIAAAALATGGVVAVHASGDDTPSAVADAPASRVEPKSRPVQPWHRKLRAGDGADKVPFCTAGGTDAGTGTGTGTGSGTDTDADAGVYCTGSGITAARLDPADGKVRWTVKHTAADASAGAESDDGAPPVLSGGLLLVTTPGRARLAALDPASGTERWSVPLSSYAMLRHTADRVLLVTYDGEVRALDSATGTERWTVRHGGTGTVWSTASGAEGGAGSGLLYAATPSPDGATTEVGALDPASGALRWTKRLTGTLTPAGASADALFLLASGTDDVTRAVVRIDAATRTVRRVPLAAPVEQAQATVFGDTVYVMGYTGSLLAVDTTGATADTGNGAGVRWRLETSVTRASRPTATKDRVYVSAGDGRLLAVDTARGKLLGQTKPRMGSAGGTVAAALAAPVALGRRVFATAPDGSVFTVAGRDPARW
ncbi:serine/threonine-protein kinase [Streptomyces paludis]|uniref:Serine/threonine protein kinase n=1 Tax=Streptomyces paludis TaxID=2282738 RepID=A0A345HP68_9ACTN|nr:serine/threonine-protein kinase [Streptomyces paludis]AXG78492.1 serine/threonine protein kinase [Streptomyces paludis]